MSRESCLRVGRNRCEGICEIGEQSRGTSCVCQRDPNHFNQQIHFQENVSALRVASTERTEKPGKVKTGSCEADWGKLVCPSVVREIQCVGTRGIGVCILLEVSVVCHTNILTFSLSFQPGKAKTEYTAGKGENRAWVSTKGSLVVVSY